MAYTLKQLSMAYTAVHNGIAPSMATIATLDTFVSLGLTDAQALSYVVNSADDTTAVAVLSYQFFTGKAPAKEGLDYLLNSAANPNDLNDPYYAKFNLENRYINFAANLGVNGAGAADFAAKYGAMSFSDYAASIYETIIGKSAATAAGVDVTTAIAYLVGTKDAVLATAKAAGMITDAMTSAQVDLALKAAMAGLVMAAAIKSDIGAYAAASNNFMLALAKGEPLYNADILTTYGAGSGLGSTGSGKAVDKAPATLPGAILPPEPPPPEPVVARNYTIQSPGETVTGTPLADVFHATDITLTGLTLNGGSRLDVLNVTAATGATYTAAPTSIRGVETVNLSNDRGVVVDTTAWIGLKTLNVNASRFVDIQADVTTDVTLTVTDQRGAPVSVTGGNDVTITATGTTDGDINVAALGDITVSRQTIAPGVAGQIAIVGGVHVDVTLTTTLPLDGDVMDMGIVLVAGLPVTESVRITGPASLADNGVHGEVVAAAVLIQDFGYSTGSTPNTIKTVEIDGFDNGGLTFFGSNLQTLTASHGTEIYIDNSDGLTTPEATTLDAILDDVHGTFDDEGVYETLNITQGADTSEIDLGMDGLKTLNLDGVGKLTLTVDPLYSPNIETVTVDGAAGLESDLSGLANLTKVDAGGTTGDVTVSIDGTRTEYAGGDGVDQVTLTHAGAVTADIDGGGGASDRITARMDTLLATGSFNSHVSGFEQLALTDLTVANSLSLNLQTLGGGAINWVSSTGLHIGFGNTLALNNFTSGGALALLGDSDANTSYTFAGATLSAGANDTINLVLSKAGLLAAGRVSMNTVENLVITTEDTQGTPTNPLDTLTLNGSALKTITVSGNAGLELTNTDTSLTLVDASGITDGDFTWTASSLAGAATIKGSATGTNTVNFSSAVGGSITYEGGSGDDDIRGNNLRTNIVHLGEGDNSYTGYATTITAGGGNDDITLSNATATVQLGDGDNTFLSTIRGNATITTGNGNDQFTIADGSDTIDVGTGDDLVAITAVDATSNTRFHAITGFGADDRLDLSAFSNAGVMGSELTGQSTLTAYLALANDVAGTTNTLHWFVVGDDIYILADRDNATSFQAGTDAVVRLVGAVSAGLDPSAATVSAGLITFH